MAEGTTSGSGSGSGVLDRVKRLAKQHALISGDSAREASLDVYIRQGEGPTRVTPKEEYAMSGSISKVQRLRSNYNTHTRSRLPGGKPDPAKIKFSPAEYDPWSRLRMKGMGLEDFNDRVNQSRYEYEGGVDVGEHRAKLRSAAEKAERDAEFARRSARKSVYERARALAPDTKPAPAPAPKPALRMPYGGDVKAQLKGRLQNVPGQPVPYLVMNRLDTPRSASKQIGPLMSYARDTQAFGPGFVPINTKAGGNIGRVTVSREPGGKFSNEHHDTPEQVEQKARRAFWRDASRDTQGSSGAKPAEPAAPSVKPTGGKPGPSDRIKTLDPAAFKPKTLEPEPLKVKPLETLRTGAPSATKTAERATGGGGSSGVKAAKKGLSKGLKVAGGAALGLGALAGGVYLARKLAQKRRDNAGK